MSKTRYRWCKKCDEIIPHDKVATLDGYSGNRPLWLDYILSPDEIEEIWKCQRCGTRTTAKKF